MGVFVQGLFFDGFLCLRVISASSRGVPRGDYREGKPSLRGRVTGRKAWERGFKARSCRLREDLGLEGFREEATGKKALEKRLQANNWRI